MAGSSLSVIPQPSTKLGLRIQKNGHDVESVKYNLFLQLNENLELFSFEVIPKGINLGHL